jgi:hypothetical protein
MQVETGREKKHGDALGEPNPQFFPSRAKMRPIARDAIMRTMPEILQDAFD